MTINSSEAAEALRSVETAQRKATELRHYAGSGAILVAWGLVWLVCHVASWIDPVRGPMTWPVGIALGVAASLWAGRRSQRRNDPRVAGTILAALGFLGLGAMLTRADEATRAALATLLVASAYVVLGLWTGARYAWLGLLLAAIVLAGWYLFPETLQLWLGIGGGGALILSGLWLRKA